MKHIDKLKSATPSYRPPALVAGGTNPTGSNRGGIARPRQPIALQATRASTSLSPGGTDTSFVGTYYHAGGMGWGWNQPYDSLKVIN
jgi:hypothetical protein